MLVGEILGGDECPDEIAELRDTRKAVRLKLTYPPKLCNFQCIAQVETSGLNVWEINLPAIPSIIC